ncbi:MAG: hypothetical protein GC165_16720 [Armatimonadetes bacterium]|nr:hypothetical protein [Armatimonadota bacterium]
MGLHTDTHSVHPTTMEMLADVSYEDGCRLALASEGRGLDAFRTAFHRTPDFWGGAGNTWAPEITYALGELRIPAYSYALTAVSGFTPHRYNGVLGLPQAISVSEADWLDDERAELRSESVLQTVQILQAPWLGIFVGHPTRFCHVQFWDVPFANGRMTGTPEESEPVDDDTYRRGLENLGQFLGDLKRRAQIVGVDEVLKMDWTFRKPTDVELDHFRTETPKAIRSAARWPIHRPGLDPEGIVKKTLALESTLEVAELAQL